ncbi:MAG: phosphoglucomutase/phosphomannomutase family protein [Synechococcaceae cyanobacterium SM2_3_1]|nr:phosphoglucomutase/phosphomannomutase family protein [Synechococcaceae cyanobacterium SM2_3_1]
MAETGIKFGTDGWRAVIAEGFTFERVRQVAQAGARVLARTYAGEGILIGYDNRFLSEAFAAAAAEAITALDIPVLLAETATPTPALSWAALHRQAHGALMITASHNPPQYSGIKIKGRFGGSVPASVTAAVEQELQQTHYQAPSPSQQARIDSFDPWPDYCQQLSRHVNLEHLRQSPLRIWVDVMHGSAAGGMPRLLGDAVQELRAERDPLFGGYAPEPLPPQLQSTMQTIAAAAAPLKVGIVFDGDGDRIAAIDGQGTFLSPQILIPILIQHLAVRRGLTGEIVKTVSGSQLFKKLATHLHLPLTETAVGFKYIAERMMSTEVLLGGEESGGIGFQNHMPERDAMLSALFLLEAMTAEGKDLSQIYAQIQDMVGYQSVYRRLDLHLQDQEHSSALLSCLSQQPPSQIQGREVVEHISVDGHKFLLTDGSWLMIRGSGTEPLLRLYSEAPTAAAVDALLDWAATWAQARL